MDYLDAKEISEIMRIKISTAYKAIQRLNGELKDKGYLTVAGRVSRRYFEERSYTGEKQTERND